jgi:hypothetical protein
MIEGADPIQLKKEYIELFNEIENCYFELRLLWKTMPKTDEKYKLASDRLD